MRVFWALSALYGGALPNSLAIAKYRGVDVRSVQLEKAGASSFRKSPQLF
jgi:hypothetical protein